MRYLPHTNEEISQMLATIGVRDVEDLFSSIQPALRCNPKLDLPAGMPEAELWSHMRGIAARNKTLSSQASFLGAGAYRHYVPAAVSELAGRSEFVTPYTPYQPEVSQGTLQAIFEYQSQICRLFAMDVSNASHYSGATALADAALMAIRIGKKRGQILVADTVHPEYREVLTTTLKAKDEVLTIPSEKGRINRAALTQRLTDKVAAVIVQYPNFFGIVEDLSDVAQATHKAGALLIAVVPEPIALGILKPPGRWGADIAVGEGMSLGLPVSFGGPTLGIFTVRQELLRHMPGRVCGQTTDAEGRTGYVLTLATREQHIRREKATSNICTNQALCATTTAIYLSLVGKEGLRELAAINASKAAYARKKLSQLSGFSLPFDAPVFNEFVLECPTKPADLLNRLAEKGILGGVDLGQWYPELNRCILVCTTEMNSREEIDRFGKALSEMGR